MNKISQCEVCGSKELLPVLNLGNHPMCDDLVPINSDVVCKEFPIEIHYCKKCYTAHQLYQVPKVELFPSNYHYRSRFTKDVLKGMEDLVESCEENFGNISGKLVLDVGCNDGSLLNFFKLKKAKTIGIEPTDAYKESNANGHFTLGEYFSVESAQKIVDKFGSPDFITFTNVFAHIEDLNEVINALKILSSDKTSIVIENHYLGAVIDKFQFDTFYHEHPRTYSYNSFKFIAKSLESKIQSVYFPPRYGGNIRVIISNMSLDKKFNDVEILKKESSFFKKLILMNDNILKWKIKTKNEILKLNKLHGKLSAKAFPGRAAILVKLLELDESIIDKVYEKPGSLKIGHYLPGTRIPICSDNDLLNNQNNYPDIIINLAWHIENEIKEYLESNNFKGNIYSILNPEDFKI